ncbi:MAG TPA: SprT family zinc-dependent metalloprotease [Azospirillaceae bacterium]|nr:SprT family zinc-dependent metalloprotease [Azospirillaceae bacterium]
MIFGRKPKPKPPRPLALAGLDEPLELRESARARRLTMRVDPASGQIKVVVPVGTPEAEVRRFVTRHDGWLKSRLSKVPERQPFAAGGVVSVLGVDHVIRHDATWRGPARQADGEILFGGQPEFLGRRVRDWLAAEALKELSARAAAKAAEIGARVSGVTVRDTKSRWGSCSAAGRLSFSWRLVLAPEWVLDYVVAHEVAHLKEMNHSPRFWAWCARLTPDVRTPRAWLKANGARLLRYG